MTASKLSMARILIWRPTKQEKLSVSLH